MSKPLHRLYYDGSGRARAWPREVPFDRDRAKTCAHTNVETVILDAGGGYKLCWDCGKRWYPGGGEDT